MRTEQLSDIQQEVGNLFSNAFEALAVIVQDGKILATGIDNRWQDITATPEVEAMRAACRAQKDAGNSEPWNLDGATLYTSTRVCGPLAYAEAQWSNTTRSIVTVDHPRANEWQTQEACDTTNQEFFQIITRNGYNSISSELTILRVGDFPNNAQKVWRELLEQRGDALLYNGIEPDSSLSRYQQIGRRLFRGKEAALFCEAV